MLRRYATILAFLALLIFDWTDPSPASTDVLDAFGGLADVLESRDERCCKLAAWGGAASPFLEPTPRRDLREAAH
jgi:hypothetical protein